MKKKERRDYFVDFKKNSYIFTVLVIAFPAAAFGYVYFKLNGIHDSSVDKNILGGSDYKSENGITNILLIGTDGRPEKKIQDLIL